MNISCEDAGNVSVFSAIIALISLLWHIIKDAFTYFRKKSDRLNLKLCDEIALYDNVYSIKIINLSPNATAYNLHAQLYIVNKIKGYRGKLPDFYAPSHLYSIKQDKDPRAREILIHIDTKRIENIEYMDVSNKKNERIDNKLELVDLLQEQSTYLAVRYNAVNNITENPKEYPMKEFYYYNIKHGFFGAGDEYVTET